METEQSGFFDGAPVELPSQTSSLEPLTADGSGVTCLWLSRKGGRSRVYKALREDYRSDPLYEQLLRKDFEIGFKLMHPHICEYYSFRQIPSLGNAIEMEYIEGRTLANILKEGRPGKAFCLKVLSETCEALDYMHGKQIYHRDIKPENILITDRGQNVKLIDFGCSDSDSHYSLKGPAGTREYASPELISGGEVDARSDIWSLGILLSKLFPGYRRIARKCTRPKQEERYSTASEVFAAVSRRRRYGRWAGAAAAAVIAAGIGLGIFMLNQKSAGEIDPDALFLSTGQQIEEYMQNL